MSVYPVRLRPIFKERIWGSQRLAATYGKALPGDVAIGESWELCDFPDDQCAAANGPWAEQSIREILGEHGEAFGFTAEQREAPFGLLIKILDANDVLSVQVHPDEAAVAKLPGKALKTECWYIMAAENDAAIYCGLRGDVNALGMRIAVQAGTVDDLLQRHSVKAGDFFFVPAGTVHAIGAGVIVAEIQTPSDTTFRLFDWNRVGANGEGRQLHLEEALTSIDFGGEAYSPGWRPPTGGLSGLSAAAQADGFGVRGGPTDDFDVLVACEYFSVARGGWAEGVGGVTLARPMVMMSLDAAGRLRCGDSGETCSFGAGDTVLVPQGTLNAEIEKAGQCLWAQLGPVGG